jgi:hypothetical protein
MSVKEFSQAPSQASPGMAAVVRGAPFDMASQNILNVVGLRTCYGVCTVAVGCTTLNNVLDDVARLLATTGKQVMQDRTKSCFEFVVQLCSESAPAALFDEKLVGVASADDDDIKMTFQFLNTVKTKYFDIFPAFERHTHSPS